MPNSFTTLLSSEINDGWKNVGRIWEHSLHRMCSRTGAFPAAIPRYFIFRYSASGDTVLDPFCGKGTTPLEACLYGRIGIGNDLCPDGYAVSRSKVRAVPLAEMESFLTKLKRNVKGAHVDLSEIPDAVKIFYHKTTLSQIVSIREILREDRSDEAAFVGGLMCGILHGNSKISLSLPCSHFFSMSPTYVAKYIQKKPLATPKRNVLKCLGLKARTVLSDPLPSTRGDVFMEDAADLPLDDESVNLIVTSPPYLDKQSYAKDNWLRLWYLGYDQKEVRDKLFHTGNLLRYADRMKLYLDEMYRVLKDDSACFVIVGDINLRGKKVLTANALLDPAEGAGFTVSRIIEDPINRPSLRHLYQNHGNRQSQVRGRSSDRIIELHKGVPKISSKSISWTSSSSIEQFMPASETLPPLQA